MTQSIKKLIAELEQLTEEQQDRYISKWLSELEHGDGALGEPVLDQKTNVTYDDIKHLLGVIDNLPPDLSSNKKYMDGYGGTPSNRNNQ